MPELQAATKTPQVTDIYTTFSKFKVDDDQELECHPAQRIQAGLLKYCLQNHGSTTLLALPQDAGAQEAGLHWAGMCHKQQSLMGSLFLLLKHFVKMALGSPPHGPEPLAQAAQKCTG